MMRGVSSAIRRGLKSRATSLRSRVCTGGSAKGSVVAPPKGFPPRETAYRGSALEKLRELDYRSSLPDGQPKLPYRLAPLGVDDPRAPLSVGPYLLAHRLARRVLPSSSPIAVHDLPVLNRTIVATQVEPKSGLETFLGEVAFFLRLPLLLKSTKAHPKQAPIPLS